MQDLRFDAKLEWKFLDPEVVPCMEGTAALPETGVFEGYASVFDVADSAGDRILPGAFAVSLARAQQDGRLPPLLWQHDTTQPIGRWLEIREDTHGLYVRGMLFMDDVPRAREAYRLMKERVVTGLSIGYRVKAAHRERDSGLRALAEVDLLEISMVTFPANDLARVHAVKSGMAQGQLPSEREFEAFLRDAGFSRKQARGVLARGYKALRHPCDAGCGVTRDDRTDVDSIMTLARRIRLLSEQIV